MTHPRLAIAVVAITLLTALVAAPSSAQCKLIDNSRDALFITFDRMAKVKGDDEKLRDGVILRLHNNSSCAVLITTGTGDKFYKPLPANPTLLQKLLREIDYELPDGALVPDFQYTYSTREETSRSVLGHTFFGFVLVGARTILFEVPANHLEFKYTRKIDVPFQYLWEQGNRAKFNRVSVLNIVEFYVAEIPEEVQRKLKKR